MRRKGGFFLISLLILGVSVGCGDASSPIEPSPPPPTSNPPTGTIWGVVYDIQGSQPALIGAHVEVLDGPLAGLTTVNSPNGGIRGDFGYMLRGLPRGTVTIQASQPGYASQVKSVSVPIGCHVGPVTIEECGIDFYLMPVS